MPRKSKRDLYNVVRFPMMIGGVMDGSLGSIVVEAGRGGMLTIDEAKAVEAIAPKTVESKRGQARFKDVLKWEVEDPTKLPAAYLMPDAAKIKRDVTAGLQIAGVKTWYEKEVALYGARS